MWTRATVQNFVREFVAPYDPSSYPIQEAGDAQGKHYEASVVLSLVQAQPVIRASGKHKGITCRPCMQGGDSPVPGGMLWVRHALGAPSSLSQGPPPRSVGQAVFRPRDLRPVRGANPGGSRGESGDPLFRGTAGSSGCGAGPSLTKGGTGKALLECRDVEPNPGGPCLGGVPPLTPAMMTLLALLMVVWLWAAQPASMWPPAAEAPLLGGGVQSCQALLALQCAHACGEVQPGRAPALTYLGVPVLLGPSSDTRQALMAHECAHAYREVQL